MHIAIAILIVATIDAVIQDTLEGVKHIAGDIKRRSKKSGRQQGK